MWKLFDSKTTLQFFKSNESSEDTNIGLADFFVFFSGKSFKICSRSISYCKMEGKFHSNSKIAKVTKNVIDF